MREPDHDWPQKVQCPILKHSQCPLWSLACSPTQLQSRAFSPAWLQSRVKGHVWPQSTAHALPKHRVQPAALSIWWIKPEAPVTRNNEGAQPIACSIADSTNSISLPGNTAYDHTWPEMTVDIASDPTWLWNTPRRPGLSEGPHSGCPDYPCTLPVDPFSIPS